MSANAKPAPTVAIRHVREQLTDGSIAHNVEYVNGAVRIVFACDGPQHAAQLVNNLWLTAWIDVTVEGAR